MGSWEAVCLPWEILRYAVEIHHAIVKVNRSPGMPTRRFTKTD